jgi:uncharacterized iron-regulated membrane protein
LQELPEEEIKAAARNLPPGRRLLQAIRLSQGDLYLPGRPGPVIKAVYGDPAETWLYLDPRRAEVVKRLDASGRLNRWLYKFLHCLDLPWLLRHDWLRQAIMLALLSGGLLLCLTGPWSWLARRRRKRRPGRKAP